MRNDSRHWKTKMLLKAQFQQHFRRKVTETAVSELFCLPATAAPAQSFAQIALQPSGVTISQGIYMIGPKSFAQVVPAAAPWAKLSATIRAKLL